MLFDVIGDEKKVKKVAKFLDRVVTQSPTRTVCTV